MADKNDGGDKTEKPTPKRLQEARKKGQVAKSREVTSTFQLVVVLAFGAAVSAGLGARLGALTEQVLALVPTGAADGRFITSLRSIGWLSLEMLLWLTAIAALPVAAAGWLAEYLQAGPVLSFEKIKPKLEHLNPAEGIKRMFTMDNLVEVVKAVFKTALLGLIGWLVLRAALADIVSLARRADLASVAALGPALWDVTLRTLGWTVGVFALVSMLDAAYQHHSFIKKLRMSRRDIQQEVKDNEGDPHIKAQRRQAHEEWSQRNAVEAVRAANVLVVNPTHVAIALDYDRETCPVPSVAAKGEDHVARAMREAAEDAGVPIVRNVDLARDLLARTNVGDAVPPDLFEIVAEVILWAREARQEMEHQRGGADLQGRARVPVPGEDQTRYDGNAAGAPR
ncbi:type III secretion system export apparatus subunit SctU [Schlegelella sp. S2-27]|uniref:Type III secretion system export apparatus subunit SctU n=1 Tax=Caldimonas mangrovi TaxID=2944811 RepID=A0ABT0YHS4_9BURK|nr:type III secretion system export apparatus subunit SctU [Caldimonas mangrovi]MCM5678279.1 type III secretion system export apparatus subunit SctU [Caldimonas mangrovi]